MNVFASESKPLAYVVLLTVTGVLGLHSPGSAHTVELGGGIHINFDQDHREIYNTAGAWSLGYSTPISPRGSVFLEATRISASGDAFTADPTFLRPRAEYWVLPLLIGLRVNFVPAENQGPLSLFGGIAAASVLSGFQDQDGQSYQAPSWGAVFEFKPQFRLSPQVSAWVRQRISVWGAVDYDSSVRELNYSGSTLQFGLSYRIR